MPLNIPRLETLNQEMLLQRVEGQRLVDEVNKKLEEQILRLVGVEVGDLVEEDRTGLQYVVASAHAYVPQNRLGRAGVSLMGRRLYKTGRRAGLQAHSVSHISEHCTKLAKEAPDGGTRS